MEIKVCKSGKMVRGIIDCNSNEGVFINSICIHMIKWVRMTVGRKSGGFVNTLTSARFRGFSEKKLPKRTWLCAGISPVRYALQTR